jgi:hypothetical protein
MVITIGYFMVCEYSRRSCLCKHDDHRIPCNVCTARKLFYISLAFELRVDGDDDKIKRGAVQGSTIHRPSNFQVNIIR